MFKELSMLYSKPFKTFTPYSSITDRKPWENLRPSLKSQLISHGETYLNFIAPPLSATLFMNFCRNGNRTDYEAYYMERRRALCSLVLAECVENEGRFLDSIINTIFTLCEESAWQLPAHNSYVRNTPNHLLPDSTRPVLDLFACETGALLAMTYYLLHSTLNDISPVVSKRIEHELNSRILTPYLQCHFWWMGQGDDPMNNWTIWCTQNILLAAFLLPQTDAIRHQIFTKANQSIDYFLNEYGDDGCCDEGAQYYRHAGLCLFNTMEVLNAITDQHYYHLYKEDKIKNIATYISNVHVDGPYYINFADCSPLAGEAGAREFLFGKRIKDEVLMTFAAQDYHKSPDHLLTQEINLFYRIQSIFTDKELLAFDSSKTISKQDLYYPSTGLFIGRDSKFCLAVKAGDNDDSHNHNDTGSFTIYKNGKPLFVDIGVESYTSKTFSPRRYEIWTMQSDYHNLPTLNGLMQKNGPQYAASSVETHFGESESSICLDLSTAYPHKGHLESYVRKVTLEKEKQIIIQDMATSIEIEVPIILNLITYEEPRISEDIISIGELGTLQFIGEVSHVNIELLPITDPRLQIAWKHDLYRIRLHLSDSAITLIIQ